MKPPKFDYAAPAGLPEALALLRASGADADVRIMAGGQSLMPALNLRLASPSLLVDLGRITELRGIHLLDDGSIVAGAMTRHRDFEMSRLVRERLPLLHAAMKGIAHPAIRSRGTIGGSLANADPAADWPALCQVCEARLSLQSSQGVRVESAGDFSDGFFTTTLAVGEILTHIRFPPWPTGRRWCLQKFARRRGDFAIVGVVVVADTLRWTIVVYGAGEKPSRFAIDEDLRVTAFRDVASRVANDTPTRSDLHASAEFRKELVEVLTRRALEEALNDES